MPGRDASRGTAPSSQGTAVADSPKLKSACTPPRSRRSQPAASSQATPVSSPARPARNAIRRRYQSSRPRCGSRSGSDQSSLERWKVAGSCGSGMLAGSQPKRGELAAAAFAHGARQFGLLVVGEVEERRAGAPLLALEQQGDEGRQQHQGGGHLQASGHDQRASRSPRARLPTWSWFCSVAEQPRLGDALKRPAVAAAAKARNSIRRRRSRAPAL